MQRISIDEAIDQVVRKDPRYPAEAYHFVREALDFTVKQFRKEAIGPERHVSGKELLTGIRQYALREYGPLACTVLNYWRLRRCEDVGEIVYNMVSLRILKTTDKDSREDFRDGYDFEEAFRKPFEPARPSPGRASSEPAHSRPTPST